MHLPIIWIERIPLLQMYFNHVIAKQGTIFKCICFKQGTQFYSARSSSVLIYYEPENWSFRIQIPRSNYVIIVKFFCIFFPNQFFLLFFFAFWRKKIKEAFSERCSLISVILPGFVKICKKYIEVNHFLLLSCSLEK